MYPSRRRALKFPCLTSPDTGTLRRPWTGVRSFARLPLELLDSFGIFLYNDFH